MNVTRIITIICGIITGLLMPMFLLSYGFGAAHDPEFLAMGILCGFWMILAVLTAP
jgi:uncharacterized membrane protein YccC